jgi:quercetin dioxygenase-like cupin family protein
MASLAATIMCAAAGTEVRVVESHPLPELEGAHLKVHVVEVTYGPGGQSPPHSHPCPVAGYVVEGAVRMQVSGGPEVVYKAGQGFYEDPHGVHLVSANASAKERAKFVAYFVCDHDTPLSVPAADRKAAGGQ